MLRISAGCACIILSTLFAAQALGLVPDQHGAVVQGRRNLCEAMAVHSTLALQQGDVASMEMAIKSICKRNPEILSAAIRKADGKFLVDVGAHDPSWGTRGENFSDDTHMQIPITLKHQHWGSVEVQFRSQGSNGFWAFIWGPFLWLAVFVTLSGFVFCSFYLKAVLKHIDPAQSKVVPDRVRATLNTIAEGVLVLDKHQRIALANEAFARTVGMSAEHLTGQKASDLPWDTVARESTHAFPWTQALQEGKTELGIILGLQTPKAGKRTFSVNSTPILDEDGSCRGALATFDDMTPIENKNAELLKILRRLQQSRFKIREQKKDLEKAKVSAENANRAKSEFLANVSHEIRTPMNAIMGLTDITLEMSMQPEQREYLELVKSSADSLMTVINEILDYSKIEAGKFKLDPIPFTLRDNFLDSLKLLAIRAHKSNLELLCDIKPNVPDLLVGDPGRLRQIIINLVGNAIKFTKEGEIVVSVHAEQQSPDAVTLHFRVSDTGIGIPQDKLKSIFEPFVQADGSTTRHYGGTGLGLAICTHLVELMHGSIWAESVLGQGSTFHFTVHFPLQANASPQALALPGLEGLPILIVDDSATSRSILEEMLTDMRFKPTLASSPIEAMEMLERAEKTGNTFAIALVDATMPEVDGFTLVRHLKERNPTDPIVIMMLSPANRQADLQRCRELDIRSYITKPYKAADLLKAVQKACGMFNQGEYEINLDAASAPASTPALVSAERPLKILLVDDNLFNQKVGSLKLEKWGHSVQVASSGREALAALEEYRFDLVFMDMQMPEMDGLETTAHIRRREVGTGQHLPIIAMTAYAGDDVRSQCLQGGMDAYVAKPIQDRELSQAMHEVLQTMATHPAAVAAAPPLAVINMETVLARVGGSTEVLQELVEVFRQDCAALLQEMGVSLQNHDGKTLHRTAHTLKGMIHFFEATAAAQLALNLESCGARSDFSEAPAAYQALQAEIARLQLELDALKKT